jgi:uncharacterized protein YjbI with pentapeptide repeats
MFDTVFDDRDFNKKPLTPGEYESCQFLRADLSGADLSDIVFIECEFRDCNLSNAKLSRTSFREVSFIHCKLLGLHFEDCIPFLQAPVFERCDCKLASFTGMKLPGIVFSKCGLQEVDFMAADLKGAKFQSCDLNGAQFDNTNLEKADLSTAFNFSIDPGKNRIRKAKFALEGLPGLLHTYQIEVQ